MIDSLAAALTVASLLAALAVLVAAGSGRYRWRVGARALVGLEVVVLLQAALALVGIAGGHHPRELATHLAYLGVSVLVLPATIVPARGDDSRWAAVLLAVAFAVVAVVTVRAETTWRPA